MAFCVVRVVTARGPESFGPFPDKRTSALWACDNTSYPWTVESVAIPKNAQEYADELERRIADHVAPCND